MDTVVIVLKQEDYQINRPDLFNPRYQPINPSSYEERITFLKSYKGQKKYFQNPSPELRKKGSVYPNLSLYERVRGNALCDQHPVLFNATSTYVFISHESRFNRRLV